MLRRKTIIVELLISCLLLAVTAYAADIDYPYADVRLTLPHTDHPIPGFGNYYTAVSKGARTVLWNPASLAKLKFAEASLSFVTQSNTYNTLKNTNLAERSGQINFSGTSESANPPAQYGIFFRYPADISGGISTREISIQSSLDYATASSGIDFASALKFNDWLTVAINTNSPVGVDSYLAGNLPTTSRFVTNLVGQSINNSMRVTSTGQLQYTYSGSGIVSTYETTQALWNGFLSQEANFPLTNISELQNNMKVDSPYTGTLASKIGALSLGLNFIPMTATANIQNTVNTIVNAGTSDIFVYTPNFDPNDPTSIAGWLNDPDDYGTSSGYVRKQIRIPAGESVAVSKYCGYYTATATKLDFGGQYDLGEYFTLGFALENYNGAAFNFKGAGISSFINYRNIDTSEVASLQDLLSPGGGNVFDVITDQWVTTNEVNGTKLALESQKTFNLPKKIRYGFCLRKPFTLAVDIENNQTPIKIAYPQNNEMHEVNISNLNYLRVGLESGLFNWPVVLRGAYNFMFKPTITGLSADVQSTIDKAFRYRLLPVQFDVGMEVNFWGNILGAAGGANTNAFLNIFQLDTMGMDLTKATYYNVHFIRDAWEINFLAELDPVASYARYQTKAIAAGSSRTFELSDLRFTQSLMATYRF